MGHDTSCGNCETEVSFCMTGPFATFLGMVCQAVRGAPRYFHGRLSASMGLSLSFMSRSTVSTVSRKMKRMRSRVPKMLAAMGNRQPLTLVNSSAGPPAWKTRRWMAPASMCASTAASMRINSPRASRASRHCLVCV